MKKLLTITAMLSAVSMSFGQGIVDFENFPNTQISTHNGATTGLMSGAPGTYNFALLSAFATHTSIDASLSGWLFEGYGYNTAAPGLMNGNYTTDPGADVAWPIGFAVNFAVIGWSANIGPTYADAEAWWNNGNPNSGPSGYFGISSVAADVIVGGGGVPVPTIFGPTVGREVQGFTLEYYSVPEPSALALVGLGAAALLISRRRKERQKTHERTIT